LFHADIEEVWTTQPHKQSLLTLVVTGRQ
jgi:hypothetical protein